MNRYLLTEAAKGTALGLAFILPIGLAATHTAQAATPEPLVSGHRAAAGVPGIPEQSIQAVQYAGRSGATYVEVDARWTRDGYVVVLHDNTLDRTTNCTGPVEAITFAQLRKCADWRTVPALSNIYRYANMHGMAVNVEIKAAPGKTFTVGQARQLLRRAATAGQSSRTILSSFHAPLLETVKAQSGGKAPRYALITSQPVTPAAVKRTGNISMASLATLTPAQVKAMHAAGVQTWAWTATTKTHYAQVVNLGVDVIVADDPAAAKSYVRSAR